jgi:hypothetical protein
MEQLKSIKQVTMSSILCNNQLDINFVQQFSFHIAKRVENPLTDCSNLVSVDANLWTATNQTEQVYMKCQSINTTTTTFTTTSTTMSTSTTTSTTTGFNFCSSSLLNALGSLTVYNIVSMFGVYQSDLFSFLSMGSSTLVSLGPNFQSKIIDRAKRFKTNLTESNYSTYTVSAFYNATALSDLNMLPTLIFELQLTDVISCFPRIWNGKL